MKAEPMAAITAPTYPTRREFLAKGTLFFLAAGCGGCSRSYESHPVVAPIFEHGEGRAYIGCDAVTAPVFLSEEEAMQIIQEELAKEGIVLGPGMPLADVKMEFKDDKSSTNHWLGEPKERRIIPGLLDAVDQKNKVGIQYVSRKDDEKVEIWGGFLNTKSVAQRFSKEFQAQSKEDLRIGVFYDPMTAIEFSFVDDSKNGKEIEKRDPNEDEKIENMASQAISSFENDERKALAKSKKLLRLQARDFVAWLKRQEKG